MWIEIYRKDWQIIFLEKFLLLQFMWYMGVTQWYNSLNDVYGNILLLKMYILFYFFTCLFVYVKMLKFNVASF